MCVCPRGVGDGSERMEWARGRHASMAGEHPATSGYDGVHYGLQGYVPHIHVLML